MLGPDATLVLVADRCDALLRQAEADRLADQFTQPRPSLRSELASALRSLAGRLDEVAPRSASEAYGGG